MTDLIKKLEEANEGSKELDWLIWRALSAAPQYTSYEDDRWPAYTRSLDAALTLVPEGWTLHLCWSPNMHFHPEFALWRHGHPAHRDRDDIKGSGGSPALALCIAALKAREVKP